MFFTTKDLLLLPQQTPSTYPSLACLQNRETKFSESSADYGTYTLEKCRREFKMSWHRIEKKDITFFVLLRSARFLSVWMKTRAISDVMLFIFNRITSNL